MDWTLILSQSFLIALFISGIRLAVPVMLAALGEVITERSGVMNLGLEGVMTAGGLAGFLTAIIIQNSALGAQSPALGPWLGMLAGIVGGMLLGLVLGLLVITLRADQVISGITLVILGLGVTTYIFRQTVESGVIEFTNARVEGLAPTPIPILSQIPLVGPILFRHDLVTYLSFALVAVIWFFLFRTTWGQNIRAVGEHPAAADTSGISVTVTRYIAVLLGSGLAGLGGAILTVQQLGLFREGVMGGRGWIAVALVIFARWRPQLALLGALLFGLADAVQFRIQALSTAQRGIGAIPYEFLLMLPYLLTLIVLYTRRGRLEAPAALAQPYVKGQR